MERFKSNKANCSGKRISIRRRDLLLACWIIAALGFTTWRFSQPEPKTKYFGRLVNQIRGIEEDPITVGKNVRKILEDALVDGHSFDAYDIFAASTHWSADQWCREIFIAHLRQEIDQDFVDSQLKTDDSVSEFYKTKGCREQIRAWHQSVYPATGRLVRALRAEMLIR